MRPRWRKVVRMRPGTAKKINIDDVIAHQVVIANLHNDFDPMHLANRFEPGVLLTGASAKLRLKRFAPR
jgi:hypothetical protein